MHRRRTTSAICIVDCIEEINGYLASFVDCWGFWLDYVYFNSHAKTMNPYWLFVILHFIIAGGFSSLLRIRPSEVSPIHFLAIICTSVDNFPLVWNTIFFRTVRCRTGKILCILCQNHLINYQSRFVIQIILQFKMLSMTI